jgi:dienelactone hydrolase
MPEDLSPSAALHRWFIQTARGLRDADAPPKSAAEAVRRGITYRRAIQNAEGAAFAPELRRTPLDPQVLGVLERDGYRVERMLLQTRPGCYATATAYVPTRTAGPFPAVLCVHGHWAGARRDPVVQSRCIGLAKLGFLAFTLDAWGAGERGTQIGQNEYHGGLLGASLWPVGTPLHGLQLFDNVRALDYLQSRPDVDAQRLGCTGASGGGNQTTYLSAFDERIQCAVPVCSVGTFESYLSTACCVDEVLIGGLTFAEEGDLLGSIAPRALMVITASKDVYHFAPEASAKALDRAKPYFRAHQAETRVRHAIFDSGHAYNQPMREAMYGWMKRWLKDEGDGSPVPEPAFQTEDPELLRCFKPPVRPGKVTTTVQWSRQRGEEMVRRQALALAPSDWDAERSRRTARLREVLALPNGVRAGFGEQLVGTKPASSALETTLVSEAGVEIPVSLRLAVNPGNNAGLVILAHPGGRAVAIASGLAESLSKAGVHVAAPELRGCGDLTMKNQGLGEQIPDHNLVEWSLWIGRPLLGQWVHDLLQLAGGKLPHLEYDANRVAVVGWREAALAALAAGALERRIRGAAALEGLASFVGDGPPHAQRMVVFSPNLLQVGDVPQLAMLMAPRPTLVAAPMRLDGMPASAGEVTGLYRDAATLYRALGKAEHGVFTADADLRQVENQILTWLK